MQAIRGRVLPCQETEEPLAPPSPTPTCPHCTLLATRHRPQLIPASNMHSAQSKLAALDRTPASPSRLRLLSTPRATRGPSYAYPRHFNPRYIPYPFEPIRPPATPLLSTIDLPADPVVSDESDEDDDFPTPPIFASPLPTVPSADFATILTFNPPPPPQPTANDLANGPPRVLKSCMRQVRRSVAASDAASIISLGGDIRSINDAVTPRPPPSQVHTTERVSSIGTPSAPPPIVDALLVFPPHASIAPMLKWDVLMDPYKSLAKPENMAIRHMADLRRWAAIRAGPVPGVPQPLTSIVLVLEDVPGLEIDVEHSVIPPPMPRNALRRPRRLYRELREPLSREELAALDEDERARLRQAADARVGYEFECAADIFGHARNMSLRAQLEHHRDAYAHAHADPVHGSQTSLESVPLRRVDRLGRRRRFLGIRPARSREVPAGREGGEVFVVELGMC
ncbi:hypothetical protein C8T65DRAFT_667906 [Cerioporus squamosus]|nr:hypothetical protein C8T65DRAFT_667906 [Cerioporus squamosus]